MKEANRLPKGKIVNIVVIVMLLIGLGFTSTAAFAYWQDVSSVGNVVIRYPGQDARLDVDELHGNFTGRLVPEGRIYFEGEVDQVVFQYEVSIDQTLVQSMNLVVKAVDVMIGEDDTYAHLVDITIGNQKNEMTYELFNSKVIVTLTVKLLEPIDQNEADEKGLDPSRVNVLDGKAAYEFIKGETISFAITFGVEPRDITE